MKKLFPKFSNNLLGNSVEKNKNLEVKKIARKIALLILTLISNPAFAEDYDDFDPFDRNKNLSKKESNVSKYEIARMCFYEFAPPVIRENFDIIEDKFENIKVYLNLRGSIMAKKEKPDSPENEEKEAKKNAFLPDLNIFAINPNANIKEIQWETSFSINKRIEELEANANFVFVTRKGSFNVNTAIGPKTFSAKLTMPFDSQDIEKSLSKNF